MKSLSKIQIEKINDALFDANRILAMVQCNWPALTKKKIYLARRSLCKAIKIIHPHLLDA
jgi:hypothetical protein